MRAKGANNCGACFLQEPFLTDDGNPYLHAQFSAEALADPSALNVRLLALPGVVESGIFVNMATEVFIAKIDGSVEHLTATEQGNQSKT